MSAPHPERRATTLAEMQAGESGSIVHVLGDEQVARRLMELGLVPGTRVEVIRRAPLGDPIEIRLRQIHLSLRHSEATHVHVESA